MIDYHPYDVHISGETNVNAHNMEKIEANCKGKTKICFAVMGDSQRWYDATEDFVKEINKRDDIDFVIHGGDMSEFWSDQRVSLATGYHERVKSTLCSPYRKS